MKKIAVAASLLAIALPAQANPTLEGVASGLYNLEKTHAFLTWTVQHNGISGYTVNFTDFEADGDPLADDGGLEWEWGMPTA